MLYATNGKIIAVIAKDYENKKIITRVYDCSKTKPKLKMQSERKSLTQVKKYLNHKFQLNDFNCLAPTIFVTEGAKKNLLERVKEICKDLWWRKKGGKNVKGNKIHTRQ